MEFRILGPLEVRADGRAVALPGPKPRAVLAVLLMHANRSVSSEQLAFALWGEEAPAAAIKTVQVHVSRLRKALGDNGVLVTTPAGYELRIDPDLLDAHRFERCLAEGRDELAAGRAERATTVLEEGLALWRGRPFDDLAYEPFAQREIPRLEDLRVAAFELLVEARLALGRHADVIGELETLIDLYPYRERLRAQLMLALYRCDRQADALQAYQDARHKLIDELGIEPSDRLRQLEQAILAQDPVLAAPLTALVAPGPPLPAPSPAPPLPAVETPAPAAETSGPARRLVSIVFADIVGSTGLGERLDPESMHDLLDRYMDVCSAVIERHGGSVEGFVGDAVVGVFGQTEVHEDDALRAVRAAVDLREAGGALSAELERDRGVTLTMKLGVDAGEVYVGAGSRRPRFAAGDAFNVAARLEQLAPAGEILLGGNIHRLVGEAVRAEPLEPLSLKGRTATVQPWRLLSLDESDGAALARAPLRPFVGRRGELAELHGAFERAREQRCCTAVTVVGQAGMGKSRLTRELLSGLAEQATVAVGRCPSYGEGVTYRPVAEIVRGLGGDDPQRWVEDLLAGDGPAARMVLGAAGLADSGAQAEETQWAVRRLFERAARERPLVVVVEDIHWAQPQLLDLLEHVAALSTGHAILLVCLARHELLEARPAWVAPQPNRSLVMLEPLPDDDAAEVVANATAGLDTAAAERIVETAEGNPLFLEQLAAVGAPEDEALPSTIQAVLAARIDALEPGERALLARASVQGRGFYVSAVVESLPEGDRAAVPSHLVSLVHKQLIRADRSELAGEDSFRFAHVLIREAAYQGLPRRLRAELHEQFARWLEERPDARDETIGYHLGEAYRNRAQLGAPDERAQELARSAAQRLSAGADAALLRGDASSGARLLERAAALLADTDPAAREQLLAALGPALLDAGRMEDAARVLDEAIARAGDPGARARAQIERELVRLEAEPAEATDHGLRVTDEVVGVLERAGDERGLGRMWLLRGQVAWTLGHVADADRAWCEAAERAKRADARPELYGVLGWRAIAAVLGPTPVPEAIERCREFRELAEASPSATAATLNPLALLHAMRGELEVADDLLAQARTILLDLGGLWSAVSHLEAGVLLLAGRPELAEERLRADVEALSAMHGEGSLATTMAMLAQAVYAQDRPDEAAELSLAAARRAGADDITTQVTWRGVRAKALARAGRCEEAVDLAREGVALAEPTDLLSQQADAMLDLAEVLRTCNRPDADRACRDGLAAYERKGHIVGAARARSLLDARPGGQ